jgi:hypothetical protein
MLFENCKNTQAQGNIGMGRCIAYYTDLGYTVCLPMNDCQEYDLVVEYPDGLKKVQVKTTRQKNRQGNYVVSLRTLGGNQSFHTAKVASNYDILWALNETGNISIWERTELENYKSSVIMKG